jgi:phage tail sheath protein FI
MTLLSSESPAVTVKEIDLTGIVPAVTSTTGAIVGEFNWGPLNTPILIGNESELASTFGSPLAGDAYAGDFLSASYFLKYSSSAFIVRADRPDIPEVPAVLDSDGTEVTPLVPAYPGYRKSSAGIFEAKYFGELGNTITVSVADASSFGTWEFEGFFTAAPIGDELHVIVTLGYVAEIVDSAGEVVVAAKLGDVVETYEFVSTDPNAKNPNGTNNFTNDVINAGSSWISASGVPAAGTNTLIGGSDGTLVETVTAYVSAYDAFLNKEAIQLDFLIPPAGGQDVASTVHQKLVEVATSRKDCVAVISPTTGNVDSMISYVDTLGQNSSYLIVDGNWFKVYNKYQDKYEFIPAASSTAGVMAAADAVSAPWFSPAGSRRGQYLGVTELLINPSKTERDKLYKKGINPIVSIPGQGVILFGDKTHQSRPSAFDRINVRRLFLVIERAISKAGENVMFEFNDEFTRAEFVNIVEPFLREIQGRRGITDFRVVCDDTNNTAEVVDRNEFIATCFIKPARSINYVTLNFVAVRTGVEFEEVVGTV